MLHGLPMLFKLNEALVATPPQITAEQVKSAYALYRPWRPWWWKWSMSPQIEALYYFIQNDLQNYTGRLPFRLLLKLIILAEGVNKSYNITTNDLFATLLKPVDPRLIDAVKNRFEDPKGDYIADCFELMCAYPEAAKQIVYVRCLLQIVKSYNKQFPYIDLFLKAVTMDKTFSQDVIETYSHIIKKYKIQSDRTPVFDSGMQDYVANKFFRHLPDSLKESFTSSYLNHTNDTSEDESARRTPHANLASAASPLVPPLIPPSPASAPTAAPVVVPTETTTLPPPPLPDPATLQSEVVTALGPPSVTLSP